MHAEPHGARLGEGDEARRRVDEEAQARQRPGAQEQDGVHRLHGHDGGGHGLPDVGFDVVHERLEEDAVLGVAAAGDVQNHPEERGAGLEALVWVALGEDG